MNHSTLLLSGQNLSLEEIHAVARGACQVGLDPASLARVDASHHVIGTILEKDAAVYGVNTGFGKLSDVRIPGNKLSELQVNLLRSHAAGLGKPLSDAEVRTMLLLLANVLAKGFSGVRPDVIRMLISLLNESIHPVVPEKGSVGASGDLAPLAHLALVLIGEGEAFYQGARIPGGEALRRAQLAPLRLEAKEGLALLNGTQAMTAVASLALYDAQRLVRLADVAGAMSLEALRGTPAAFDPRIQEARPHRGQATVARHLITLLDRSEIRESHRTDDSRIQDAYCLRCMPQVHGAVRDALDHVTSIVLIETGSATDNPLVFATGEEVISGGNFHGAPLSYGFDYAAIVLTDLAGISERRIDRLINPDINEGLPPFLSSEAGLSSGFMIAHVAAAALLNECKVLAHPASVDNVPTSGGKEDHVSMGMTAALKLRQIVENVEQVLAIELLCAAQGLDYRKPLRPGRQIEQALAGIRNLVPGLVADRPPATDINRLVQAIREGAFDGVAGPET
ncbi:MAG: histidine ammonia-lyase [Terracidiphilus sp.]|jgi:histidine ammonia-lyase